MRESRGPPMDTLVCMSLVLVVSGAPAEPGAGPRPAELFACLGEYNGRFAGILPSDLRLLSNPKQA
jgi:hypothetical protein